MAEEDKVWDLNQGEAPHAPEAAGGTVIGKTLSKVEKVIEKSAAPASKIPVGGKLAGARGLLRRAGWIGAVAFAGYDIYQGYKQNGVTGAIVATVDTAVVTGAAVVAGSVGATVGSLAGPVGTLAGGLGAGYVAGSWTQNHVVPAIHKFERLMGIRLPNPVEGTGQTANADKPGLVDSVKNMVGGLIPGLGNHPAPADQPIVGGAKPATANAGANNGGGTQPSQEQAGQAQTPAITGNTDLSAYALSSGDNFGNSPELAKQMQGALQKAKGPTGKAYGDYDDVKAETDPAKRDVKVLQHYLQDNGYMPVDAKEVDGLMGPKTRAATQAFLKANNPDYAGPVNGETFSAQALANVNPKVEMYTQLLDRGLPNTAPAGVAPTAAVPSGPSGHGLGQLRMANTGIVPALPANVQKLGAILGAQSVTTEIDPTSGKEYAVITAQRGPDAPGGLVINSVEQKQAFGKMLDAAGISSINKDDIDTNAYRTAMRIPVSAITSDVVGKLGQGTAATNDASVQRASPAALRAQQSAAAPAADMGTQKIAVNNAQTNDSALPRRFVMPDMGH